jgi:hypothetical protein
MGVKKSPEYYMRLFRDLKAHFRNEELKWRTNVFFLYFDLLFTLVFKTTCKKVKIKIKLQIAFFNMNRSCISNFSDCLLKSYDF